MTDNKKALEQSEETLQIKDLAYMCLAKWHWFVISLVVCLGIAKLQVLRTHPVYSRTASILVKDDMKGGVFGDAQTFADMGAFRSATNVNNELVALASADLMNEVARRLKLDINYSEEGTFYDKTIYGDELPVKVDLLDLGPNDVVSFTMNVNGGKISISDIIFGGEELEKTVSGKLNENIETPFGKIIVTPTSTYTKDLSQTIQVSKTTISAAAAGASARLAINQDDMMSSVISLSFSDVSSQRAEDVLNTLISVYNESWVKDKNQIAVSTSMFINERLKVIEGELSNVDSDISSYKSANLLPNIEAAANMYMQQANEATAAIKDLNNQVYMARYIKSYLSNSSNNFTLLPANLGIQSKDLNSLIGSYNDNLLERNKLVGRSSEKNPLVIEIDATLRAQRAALLNSIDNEIVALEAQIKSLQSVGGQATSQIASNPKQAKYLLSVERQQKVKESLYLYLLQKREENELSQAFTAYNTRVITKPSGSNAPIAPNGRNILLIGFAIGLLIPIAIIYLRETLNTVVRGKKDIKAITMPFLGEIPHAFPAKKKLFFAKKQKDIDAIVVKPGKRDVVNEAFRVLRTNLEFLRSSDGKCSTVMMTSFNPGSGKSFLTMNLAVTLAIQNKRVLVIDCDMRHASSSSYIGSPSSGMSDYLAGIVSDIHSVIVKDDNHPTMSVLPVGKIPPNPSELLTTDRFTAMVDSLRDEFDYILIDCPPVELVADAQIVQKVADRTIFVIRAGVFERSMLPDLQKIYDNKKYKNMSLILNGTEVVEGRYGSRYGYNYGYGSSSYYGDKSKA